MKKLKDNVEKVEEINKKFVIVEIESDVSSKIEPKMKYVFKVNKQLKFRDILIVLKKKLHLGSKNALFLFSKGKILNCQILISDLIKKNHLKKKEVLFLKYSETPAFGKKHDKFNN